MRELFRGAAAIVAGLLAATIAWSSAMAQAEPPTRVGRLAFIDGVVSFHDDRQVGWNQAVVNTPLTSGDALWTEPGAHSEISVAGSRVRLDGATQLDMLALDDSQTRLQLSQGRIDIKTFDLDTRQPYQIVTPRAAPVGWFPLGPREVYVPPYTTNRDYYRRLNRSARVDDRILDDRWRRAQRQETWTDRRAAWANQRFATVVPSTAFIRSEPVSRAALHVAPEKIATAPVAPVAAPPAPTASMVSAKAAPVAPSVEPKSVDVPVAKTAIAAMPALARPTTTETRSAPGPKTATVQPPSAPGDDRRRLANPPLAPRQSVAPPELKGAVTPAPAQPPRQQQQAAPQPQVRGAEPPKPAPPPVVAPRPPEPPKQQAAPQPQARPETPRAVAPQQQPRPEPPKQAEPPRQQAAPQSQARPEQPRPPAPQPQQQAPQRQAAPPPPQQHQPAPPRAPEQAQSPRPAAQPRGDEKK